MILYLIRHGITEGNEKHLYCGSTDIPLSQKGREQLAALAEQGGYPTAERYFTSGMLRTEETFAMIYGSKPHEVLPGMRETDFGVFEMQSYDMLKERADYQAWITGDMETGGPPRGESNGAVLSRALEALAPVLHDDSDTVCITHGGIIAALLGHWFHVENRYTVTPPPGTGWAVAFKNGLPEAYTPIPRNG